jgi:hypothetical protein
VSLKLVSVAEGKKILKKGLREEKKKKKKADLHSCGLHLTKLGKKGVRVVLGISNLSNVKV